MLGTAQRDLGRAPASIKPSCVFVSLAWRGPDILSELGAEAPLMTRLRGHIREQDGILGLRKEGAGGSTGC